MSETVNIPTTSPARPNTCGRCMHFVSGASDNGTGVCFFNPPVVGANGLGAARPAVTRNTRACGRLRLDPTLKPDATGARAITPGEAQELMASLRAQGRAVDSTAPSPKNTPRGKRG